MLIQLFPAHLLFHLVDRALFKHFRADFKPFFTVLSVINHVQPTSNKRQFLIWHIHCLDRDEQWCHLQNLLLERLESAQDYHNLFHNCIFTWCKDIERVHCARPGKVCWWLNAYKCVSKLQEQSPSIHGTRTSQASTKQILWTWWLSCPSQCLDSLVDSCCWKIWHQLKRKSLQGGLCILSWESYRS